MTREPNPLPLVRQYLAERQHRRRTVAIIKSTRRPGRGHTDMALETYERFTATGEN